MPEENLFSKADGEREKKTPKLPDLEVPEERAEMVESLVSIATKRLLSYFEASTKESLYERGYGDIERMLHDVMMQIQPVTLTDISIFHETLQMLGRRLVVFEEELDSLYEDEIRVRLAALDSDFEQPTRYTTNPDSEREKVLEEEREKLRKRKAALSARIQKDSAEAAAMLADMKPSKAAPHAGAPKTKSPKTESPKTPKKTKSTTKAQSKKEESQPKASKTGKKDTGKKGGR